MPVAWADASDWQQIRHVAVGGPVSELCVLTAMPAINAIKRALGEGPFDLPMRRRQTRSVGALPRHRGSVYLFVPLTIRRAGRSNPGLSRPGARVSSIGPGSYPVGQIGQLECSPGRRLSPGIRSTEVLCAVRRDDI